MLAIMFDGLFSVFLQYTCELNKSPHWLISNLDFSVLKINKNAKKTTSLVKVSIIFEGETI